MKLPSFFPPALTDPLIRRAAKPHAVTLSRYSIRVATTQDEYEDAFRLLRVAYIVQGYENVKVRGMRMTQHHVLPEATVLVAYEGDRIVGTMTMTLDSPAGLPIEHYYGAQLSELRRVGARVVEWGSLAVLDPCVGTGLSLLMNMAAYAISRQLGASHCVIEVHPRALPIYRALFGFSPIGLPVAHQELRLDVVGMSLDLAQAPDLVRPWFSKPMANGRTVVENFLTPPACVRLPPPLADEAYALWKMPPALFDQLFTVKSDLLVRLDPRIRAQLHRTMSARKPEDVPMSIAGAQQSSS